MLNSIAVMSGAMCLTGGVILIAKCDGWAMLLGGVLIGLSYGWVWRKAK